MADQPSPESLAFAIPALDPTSALLDVARTLAEQGFPVIIVNDGSGPNCQPLFEACAALPGITLLRHPANLGKGAALKTAIRHIQENFQKCKGIVTADADGQHSPPDILRVAEAFLQHPDSLVLGARQFDKDDIPLRSRLGNSVTRYAVRFLIGHTLTDTQTGLRAIPRKLWADLLKIRPNRYDFELEMLLACKQARCVVLEVPIETIYLDGNRSSNFNPLRDSLKIYFVLLRFASVSFMTAVIDNLIFGLAYTGGFGLGRAQIVARCGAVLFNYALARRAVFLSNEKHFVVIPLYLANVAVSGVASYLLIRFLMSELGMQVFWAKILAESLLFFANFFIQRDLVFVKRGNQGAPAGSD